MGRFEVIAFSDATALARGAATAWLDTLKSRNSVRTPISVALSGGRIAQDFFQAVVREARDRSASFDNVRFFWGDERCAPPTHTESNFAQARAFLLEPLDIPPLQIHRLRGEGPQDLAVVEAEAGLRRLSPLDRNGLPTFDLIFLGMGEDGHIASLFPGEPEEAMNRPAVYRAVVGPKPPPRRITLGYGVIAAAREV
jgi:6-phosphogluconolactonase